MAIAGDTGNGATLTLALYNGTTSVTAVLEIIEITPAAITCEKIDASHLGTSGHREYLPGDLSDSAENSCTFKWLTTLDPISLPSPAGTFTITLPTRSGETTPATVTGTGFATGITPPPLQNGTLQIGTISWAWNGDTGPSITKAS